MWACIRFSNSYSPALESISDKDDILQLSVTLPSGCHDDNDKHVRAMLEVIPRFTTNPSFGKCLGIPDPW